MGPVDNQRKRNYDDAELFEKTDKSNASESKQFKLAESSEEDNLEDDSAAICQNNEEVQNTLEVPTEDTELSEVSTVTAKASSMDIDDFLEKYTDIKMGDTKLVCFGRESGIAHGPTKKPDTIGELVSRIFMHAKNLPIYADFIESIENKVNSLKEELENQKSFICQNNPEIMTKIQSAPENEVWLLKDNLEHLAESSKQLAQAQWQCVKSKLYKSLTMSMNMTIDSDIQTIVDQVFHFGNPQELLLAATQHLEAENHKLELETKEMAEKGELPSTE
uniref:Uncharacterized protein n=1 Tax=Ciona savignyi TaxID=51511 RepID=H2YFN7_CIOSA